mmetsp:Transcript_24250/g.38840  ORF Transcript_24250/g.38840 Transcript_24250/m.38840 type:complete len:103 (+) Transcript_24250:736-1044(+)
MSPIHTAIRLGPVHGAMPPPKQCADVNAKVGEIMDAPHPSHSSESALLVGKTNIACSFDDLSTTVPLMIRIVEAPAKPSFVAKDKQHVMCTTPSFIFWIWRP